MANRLTVVITSALLLIICFLPSSSGASTIGKVVDFNTRKPIAGAIVTVQDKAVFTDDKGVFILDENVPTVAVRAPGYLRTIEAVPPRLFTLFSSQSAATPHEIKLVPFSPKALYLSFYGIGDRGLRNSALRLIDETELNALVIDVKGDRGMIPYKSSVSLSFEIGAQKITTVRDMQATMRSLKERGVYTIARIVVFKDTLLAQSRLDLAIKGQNGDLWRDREGLAWIDPFKTDAWHYNIDIAVEAAQLGFDEIQFDYVRFPDAVNLTFSQPNTEENRTGAIAGFLREARKRLTPYNVFLAADIFGYVCWNPDDTKIGQKLETLVPHLDYFSPMLYPSGFQYGIPGYRIPVENPYKIVYLSLKKARERTGLSSTRFRPWLQAFRDYAFDRRHFTAREIREQITAADEFGSQGWMLWNPRNVYIREGLGG